MQQILEQESNTVMVTYEESTNKTLCIGNRV